MRKVSLTTSINKLALHLSFKHNPDPAARLVCTQQLGNTTMLKLA
jgi:hypothetical protein